MERPDHDEFKQVSARIRENAEKINEVLSNAVVESDVVSREEQISNFLSTKQSDFILNEPSSEYYDLDRVKNIFEMMDIKPEPLESKPDLRKRPKNMRAESACNLTMAPLDSTFVPPKISSRAMTLSRAESYTSFKSPVPVHSNEEVTSSEDSCSEIIAHLSAIRETLQSITNGHISCPDLANFQAEATAKSVIMNDAKFKVNRLLKELQSIAASDQSSQSQVVPGVDNVLIENLEKLSQTLSDIALSSSNPIGDHPKSEDCSFQLTKVINRILEAFENNPLN